jgi:non-ribosomal peptide synthetase component E (peptide arylation enzyme)
MLQHPAMQQVAAVAAPDTWSGENICVFATLRPGTELKLVQLRSFLLERGLARYKLPDRLELLAELPSTPVGKLDKVTLRRWAAREQR